MKNKIIILICYILTFGSCVSEKAEKSANNVAEFFGAETAFIGYEKGIDSNTGSQSTIELTLMNPSKIEQDYSLDRVGSLAAKLLIEELIVDDTKNVNRIKIIVTKDNKTSEIIYNLNDIKSINQELDIVFNYFKLADSLQIEPMKELIDFDMISENGFDVVKNATLQIDSIFGKGLSYTVTGFKFDKTEKQNEPIVVVWAEGKFEKTLMDYTFYIRRSNNKMIFFNVTER